MRQALDQPVSLKLGAVEQIVDVLLQNSTDEQEILSRVATVLVQTLEYAAAVILTGDDRDTLYLRAFQLNPSAPALASLQPALQQALCAATPFLQSNDPHHAHSLALRALADSALQPLLTDDLSDLLHPLHFEDELPHLELEAHSAVAVPYYLPGELCVCLLLVCARPSYCSDQLHLLQLIARHLALGLHNARLYQRMEQQQRVAQTFAQMAFSSSAYLHTLRNQIGGLRTYLGLVAMLPHMSPEQRAEVIATGKKATKNLDQAAEILDHLHEPWSPQAQTATNVNESLTAAIVKVFRGLTPRQREQQYVTSRGMHIQWHLQPSLPPVLTSPDMLTEAFHIVIRNAVDALHDRYGRGAPLGSRLTIESALGQERHVIVTIRDNGPGIKLADQQHIFDLGWTTKEGKGMGFGLFWTRNFVEGLGGRLEVESTPGEGAAFRFRLPTAPD